MSKNENVSTAETLDEIGRVAASDAGEGFKSEITRTLENLQAEHDAAVIEIMNRRPSRARRWTDTAKTVAYCGAAYGAAMVAIGLVAGALFPAEEGGE